VFFHIDARAPEIILIEPVIDDRIHLARNRPDRDDRSVGGACESRRRRDRGKAGGCSDE
jgi:hypothetical protein